MPSSIQMSRSILLSEGLESVPPRICGSESCHGSWYSRSIRLNEGLESVPPHIFSSESSHGHGGWY